MTWAPHPHARRLTPVEEALHSQRLRAQQAAIPHFSQRMPPAPPFASQAGLGASGDGVAVSIMALSFIALYVGTTVASYYLVRDMAPKKSAKSYGAGAAAANLFFPIVGPVVVGVAAASAQGKR